MKIVRISKNGRFADGFVEGESVLLASPWRDGGDGAFALSRLAPADVTAARAASRDRVPLSDVRLELPVDARNKIICIGINYRDHVGEVNVEVPKQPALFLRQIDSLVGPADGLIAPSQSITYDYEGEIAVVIGKVGRDIAAEDAMSHVLGYSCFMDGSVREYQRHSVTAGKNFWRSGAMGPWITTADEAGDIRQATLETRVNGEVLQSTTADLMIFDIPAIIAYCSRWTQLNPGDVIATGTPSGVGLFREPKRWLKPGAIVEVTVSAVGALRNRVSASG